MLGRNEKGQTNSSDTETKKLQYDELLKAMNSRRKAVEESFSEHEMSILDTSYDQTNTTEILKETQVKRNLTYRVAQQLQKKQDRNKELHELKAKTAAAAYEKDLWDRATTIFNNENGINESKGSIFNTRLLEKVSHNNSTNSNNNDDVNDDEWGSEATPIEHDASQSSGTVLKDLDKSIQDQDKEKKLKEIVEKLRTQDEQKKIDSKIKTDKAQKDSAIMNGLSDKKAQLQQEIENIEHNNSSNYITVIDSLLKEIADLNKQIDLINAGMPDAKQPDTTKSSKVISEVDIKPKRPIFDANELKKVNLNIRTKQPSEVTDHHINKEEQPNIIRKKPLGLIKLFNNRIQAYSSNNKDKSKVQDDAILEISELLTKITILNSETPQKLQDKLNALTLIKINLKNNIKEIYRKKQELEKLSIKKPIVVAPQPKIIKSSLLSSLNNATLQSKVESKSSMENFSEGITEDQKQKKFSEQESKRMELLLAKVKTDSELKNKAKETDKLLLELGVKLIPQDHELFIANVLKRVDEQVEIVHKPDIYLHLIKKLDNEILHKNNKQTVAPAKKNILSNRPPPRPERTLATGLNKSTIKPEVNPDIVLEIKAEEKPLVKPVVPQRPRNVYSNIENYNHLLEFLMSYSHVLFEENLSFSKKYNIDVEEKLKDICNVYNNIASKVRLKEEPTPKSLDDLITSIVELSEISDKTESQYRSVNEIDRKEFAKARTGFIASVINFFSKISETAWKIFGFSKGKNEISTAAEKNIIKLQSIKGKLLTSANRLHL